MRRIVLGHCRSCWLRGGLWSVSSNRRRPRRQWERAEYDQVPKSGRDRSHQRARLGRASCKSHRALPAPANHTRGGFRTIRGECGSRSHAANLSLTCSSLFLYIWTGRSKEQPGERPGDRPQGQTNRLRKWTRLTRVSSQEMEYNS
jgi:hypothetical protein